MKSTNHLMQDHKYILRALNILERMAEETSMDGILPEQDVEDLLRFLTLFVNRHHQDKEEAVLFPAILQDANDPRHSQIRQMVLEHNQERSLVEGLEDALRTKDAADFVALSKRLILVLRSHIYKEDHILFELADQVMTHAKDEQVERYCEAFEKDWKDRVFPALSHKLNELEWKYLRRKQPV